MTATGRLSRRQLLRAGAALIGCDDDTTGEATRAAREHELITRLSYNTASGGGVNVKRMPHPQTGDPTVELEEVFSFDRNHALCRVDTNPRAFVMPTHELGDVVIEPHTFFMAMYATSIEQFVITTTDAGASVVMRGGLDCATEVGRAETRLGDRHVSEHATYRIEAFDGGVGGGETGDRFAFTVYFEQADAPLNFQIFGPEFTFTGDMVRGEITIVDPAA